MNEQLQQFFIQQAAAAAAAAAVFSSLWNGQQPPNNQSGGSNQQVQSQRGGDNHDSSSQPSGTNTGNSISASQQVNNPLEALLANASPVTLAALAQNFQKQQDGFSAGMPDQQQAAMLAAAIRSSSNPSSAVAALNLPSVLQHQLNNLISPPSNHNTQQQQLNTSSNNKLHQLNTSGSTSSSPSSAATQQQLPATNKSQSTYHQYHTNSSANGKSTISNNQAINNQQLSHSNNTTSNNTSLDGGKVEVGLNMTTTALSLNPNTMQSLHTRTTSSPVTNTQAPINAASQQHQNKTSSHHHHHQSSHKQSASSNSPREPISSSVLAKNNVGLPRKLVRGQDVWLGRGAEQTRQILKCMWCGQSCRTLADLSQHMKETQHYTNIVSQEQITSWRTPENDLAQSQVNQVFTCKVCDEAFSSLNELSNHMVKKSHYNGQSMNSPVSNYNLVGGEHNGPQMINQQHLLTTATANRKSPTLSNPDTQSISQIGLHKKQRNISSYNEYDNRSVSPHMASNSTKERRKKSLPVRKLLELERKGSSISNRHNQSKNDVSIFDNMSGLENQDSDGDDTDRDNSSMALMSRMLDRQETTALAYTDNDEPGMSDDDIGHNTDDVNCGGKRYYSNSNNSKINDSRVRKRRHTSHNDDYDDEGDESSDNLDTQSQRARPDQAQLSPVMSDHESVHSSTSASYKNQIHIDTTNLTNQQQTQCSDCHNHQKKSSYRQKCKSCLNSTLLATSSTLLKPGTVSRQLLASLTNNKLDPDQVDEDLLNKPLMYDDNDDVKINLDDRLSSILENQTSTKTESQSRISNKIEKDNTTKKESGNTESSPTNSNDTTKKDEQESEFPKLDEKASSLASIKTEKIDGSKVSHDDSNNHRASRSDFDSCSKTNPNQDIKVARPQTLSTASPSEKSGKAKSSSNGSSLSALEMLVEKSFDTKTRRGAQNTGILQRLGIDEEICPPWQHMNYASWYAAAAASYGGIPCNQMTAMTGIPGYPLTPGMPMSAGNVTNTIRSHNSITPMSGIAASMTPPMRTPSSSPPTNASSPPYTSNHQHSSHNNNKSVIKSMPMDQSVSNLQIEASSSPSLNSLMATTHQQLQNLTSSSLHQHSPHSSTSSPTTASMNSTKGLTSSASVRNSKRPSPYGNNDDDDTDEGASKSTQHDKKQNLAWSRRTTSSSSRNTTTVKNSKKSKLSDESSTDNNNTNQTTNNRYPRRSKASTTLNKLKQQLESESEDDFEEYDNSQEPVSLAMKKSIKPTGNLRVSTDQQQPDFQLNQAQMQQLQLQLLQSQQQMQQQRQQLPNEDVNQQSLAAMQATFLLKQLMTQAMASMVTGNQVQPTTDNLASVQQYLLGNMLNQSQTHQQKQSHADDIQQSSKNSVRRSFSDDNDENDREEISEDGDCVDFTSSSASKQQQQHCRQETKISSRARVSAKKPASKKSSTSKRTSRASSSSFVTDSQQQDANQQDISNSEKVPNKRSDRCTIAPSEENDLVCADHSLLKQENQGRSSRRRKQKTTNQSRKDDDSDLDANDDGQQITGHKVGDDRNHRLDHVMSDEQEIADFENQPNRKSIIGNKINVDSDLNDSTTTTTLNMKKKKKQHEESEDGSADHEGSSSKDNDNADNIDQDKYNRHHQKSIANVRTALHQKQTVVSGNDVDEEVLATKEVNTVDSSSVGSDEREMNPQSEETSRNTVAHEATCMVNEKKETNKSASPASSQEITANSDHADENTNKDMEERHPDQTKKTQDGVNPAFSEESGDDVENLSTVQLKKRPNQSSGKRHKQNENSCDGDADRDDDTSRDDDDCQDIDSESTPGADDKPPIINKINSNIVEEHNNSNTGSSDIKRDDLTSSDDDNEDNEDDMNYITSSPFGLEHTKSLKNNNGQQQTVIAQVSQTNGDSKSILEVKP